MKFRLLLSGLLLGLFLGCLSAHQFADALEAGVAKIEITPMLGVPLHGYGARQGRGATGTHDPLWARSLYLDDGETQVFLVSVDLLLISTELRERVLELAPGQIPSENIILTATHTHNGPGGIHRELLFRLISGRYMPEVVDVLSYHIAESMRQAYENRSRASIGYGAARNPGLSTNRANPDGPIDNEIGVIRVDDADGNPISIVGILAAHPTLVPRSDQYNFSADFPGVFYEELEQMSTEGCIAIFLNGALGNQSAGNPDNNEGWNRVTSVGNLLALQVKGAANDILCGEASIYVGHTRAQLPHTMSPGLFPESVILQTLEIDDLLLTFFPGEPVVEIGLELRQRALNRGYERQYVIGLANDALLYFLPWEHYAESTYESSLNFYGPRIADWFYEEFEYMMRKPPPDTEDAQALNVYSLDLDNIQIPEPDTVDNGAYLLLEGTSYVRGYQLGRLMGHTLLERFDEYIHEPIIEHQLIPDTGIWGILPSFINPSSVALPALGYAVRSHLSGISADLRLEIEGIATGADLHFDKVWLLQHAGHLPYVDDRDSLFKLPFCTMLAVTDDRAGNDSLLVARNLDWVVEEEGYVVEIRPDTGRRLIQVGFGWNSGVYSGMNDAGLVLCLERLPLTNYAVENHIAPELLLRDILSQTTTVSGALEKIENVHPVPGYQLLIAGFDNENPRAVVVSYNDSMQVREPQDGILLGVDPRMPLLDEATRIRYERADLLVQNEAVLSLDRLQHILRDEESGQPQQNRIWNSNTRHSVVFHPHRREMHVAFRNDEGKTGAYTTFSLRGE